MPLFHLEEKEYLRDVFGFDEMVEFVVTSKDEENARKLCYQKSKQHRKSSNYNAWLNKDLTTCVKLEHSDKDNCIISFLWDG